MNETFAVNVFYSRDELIGEKQDSFQTESSGTKIEKVFETGTKQLHDHDVEVALRATPLDLRDTNSPLHHPVEL